MSTLTMDKLKVLSELFSIEVGSSLVIGFVTITRVDTNTFTIMDIDADSFLSTITNEGLEDELRLSKRNTN